MKKILIVITAIAIIAACSKPVENDEAAKRQQLKEYKQQLHDLESQIETLEKELAATEDEEVVNVKVNELEAQFFEHFIDVTGEVEADLNINVSPETIGTIETIYVTEGDRVTKGQQLAKLNTNALERGLEEVQVQYELAQTNYKRQKNLWDQNIGSEMQYLQAKSNMESLEKRVEGIKAQMDMATIESPVSGVIDVIYQKKGEIGSPQIPFAKVVNISDLKIYADVSESFITKINQGDRVSINFPALKREMSGKISRIGNTIDPNNRTFRIRIDLKNPDNMIKPNLVSILKIRDYAADSAIVIPSLYIKEDFVGNYTFIAKNENGKTMAQKVYITPGVSDNNLTEIEEGLEPGMQIISEGFGQVADGTLLNIK